MECHSEIHGGRETEFIEKHNYEVRGLICRSQLLINGPAAFPGKFIGGTQRMGARQLGQDDDKARRAEGYEEGSLVGTNLYSIFWIMR